jgi:hypothetical protein
MAGYYIGLLYYGVKVDKSALTFLTGTRRVAQQDFETQ